VVHVHDTNDNVPESEAVRMKGAQANRLLFLDDGDEGDENFDVQPSSSSNKGKHILSVPDEDISKYYGYIIRH
jgi:hypothetical protein